MKSGYIYLLSPIAFSICRQSYYLPQAQNVPLFKEKNEMWFCASYGITEEISRVDVQAAYSISNNFAVMARVCTVMVLTSPLAIIIEGYYLDAAMGYY